MMTISRLIRIEEKKKRENCGIIRRDFSYKDQMIRLPKMRGNWKLFNAFLLHDRINETVIKAISESASQLASQLINCFTNLSVSQSVSLSVIQSVSESVGESVRY